MAHSLDDKRLRQLAQRFDGRLGQAYLYCPLLSAAMAAKDEKAIRLIMQWALDSNISNRTINEIILQSHLFLGFPAMIEASRLFAELNHRKHNRNHLPTAYNSKMCRAWNNDGLKKIRKIYGTAFDRLVSYINSFSPQVLTWMINDGYGQVLSRPGASFKLREISVVATLTVTSYKNQLSAHIRGALNLGVQPDLIERTINNCRFFCRSANIRSALEILTEVQGA
jgi:4-carboxymuconolactone decarboxylase